MSSLVRQMLKTASLSTEIFMFLYHDTNISTNLHIELFFHIKKRSKTLVCNDKKLIKFNETYVFREHAGTKFIDYTVYSCFISPLMIYSTREKTAPPF
jgi:hypothetical protein